MSAGQQAQRDRRAKPDHLDLLALWESQGLKEKRAIKATRVRRAHEARRGRWGRQATRGTRPTGTCRGSEAAGVNRLARPTG